MRTTWPQPGNYYPKMVFNVSPLPVKPTPLEPYCYEKRNMYLSEIKKANEKLEAASKFTEKLSNELAEAQKSVKDNRWSKSTTKASLVNRLQNDYTRATQQEDLARSSIEEIEKKYKVYNNLVEIQERMEKNYAEFCEA
jgi:hypothetical protein